MNWPAAYWKRRKQIIHHLFQEENHMEIFSVGSALFQFLASLMTLLSRFPLLG